MSHVKNLSSLYASIAQMQSSIKIDILTSSIILILPPHVKKYSYFTSTETGILMVFLIHFNCLYFSLIKPLPLLSKIPPNNHLEAGQMPRFSATKFWNDLSCKAMRIHSIYLKAARSLQDGIASISKISQKTYSTAAK